MQRRTLIKWVTGTSLAAFATTAGYALTLTGSHLDNFRGEDSRNDGSLTQSTKDKRDITFRITSKSASRAELRRNAQKSGKQSMGGKFRLITHASGADRLSIIQVLSVQKANATSGSSYVNEQLAIRKTGRRVRGKAQWEFYLVHQSGQPSCTSFKFIQGNQFNIKMEYEKSKRTKFIIKSGKTERSCSSKSSRSVGKNEDGNSGRYYYGKLGVYATGSGKGSASVKWDNIYD